MKGRFVFGEHGGTRSSLVFAMVMGLTAFGLIAGLTAQDRDSAEALNELSDTQFLSSQKLQ